MRNNGPQTTLRTTEEDRGTLKNSAPLCASAFSAVTCIYSPRGTRTKLSIAIAAAEAAVGLAMVIAVYRHFRTTNVDQLNRLKG